MFQFGIASSAELYAILSDLAGVPINQEIAVTRSVNQNGELQAIGGINQKIEGFLDVCRIKGLTGKQGVLVPRSNLRNLMLRRDVVVAAQDGQFHVYAVGSIDDGIEVLTGTPAGQRDDSGRYPASSISGRVEKRLQNTLSSSSVGRKKMRVIGDGVRTDRQFRPRRAVRKLMDRRYEQSFRGS